MGATRQERERRCYGAEVRDGRPAVVPSTIGKYMDDDVKVMRDNLAILEDPLGARRPSSPDRKLRSDGTYLPEERRKIVWGLAGTAELREALQERTRVGGARCDGCKRTREELGMTNLLCCQRCTMAFYCSRECQKQQWRAGHKQACREKGEIHPGDFLRLEGLVARPELNGFIVRAVGPVEGDPDRWQVEHLSQPLAAAASSARLGSMSIAIKNLAHIRPEK
jgi:hypothetical protein